LQSGNSAKKMSPIEDVSAQVCAAKVVSHPGCSTIKEVAKETCSLQVRCTRKVVAQSNLALGKLWMLWYGIARLSPVKDVEAQCFCGHMLCFV
jgi:hypothetical protein